MVLRVFSTICMIITKMEILVFPLLHILVDENILDPSKFCSFLRGNFGLTIKLLFQILRCFMFNFSYETMFYDDYYMDDLGFIPGLSFFKKWHRCFTKLEAFLPRIVLFVENNKLNKNSCLREVSTVLMYCDNIVTLVHIKRSLSK